MTALLVDRPLVILVYPQVEHEKDYLYHWMPFSLLTIAKPLMDNGVEVVIFDGNQRPQTEWPGFLDEHADRAMCIGISIMTGGAQIRHALEMAEVAQNRPGCPPLVFGGPHVNVLAEQTAEHELVDVTLAGPGQASMPAFVEALRNRAGWDSVPGLLAVDGRNRIEGPINPPRAGNLGAYPWDLLAVGDYIRDDPTVAPRTLNYVSSQGCVYKCAFCYELTYQRKYSAMQADSLLDDLADLADRYGINGVKFYDADWFVNVRRAVEFCQLKAERGIDLAWAASINPNDVLRARKQRLDLLGSIADSGCRRLLMGIESGDDRVLREVVRKEVTRAQVLDVARDIADHGILGAYTFIVGFPDETEAEIEATYSLIEEISTLDPRPETRVHLFGPFPGVPLFDLALERGFQAPTTLAQWADFDYYDSQTPWTSSEMVARARAHTRLVKAPGAGVS